MTDTARYSIPACVTKYIEEHGYHASWHIMQGHIMRWGNWLRSVGDFYDYSARDASGASYRVHRRSVHPAKRVCNEWASLLMDEKTNVQCQDETCNEWLDAFYTDTNFWANGQEIVMKSFALGTGAWAMWIDTAAEKIMVRRYEANQVIPLSWDDDGVSECAFATRAVVNGSPVDQLQMHIVLDDGYHIITALFDENGEQIHDDGVIEDLPIESDLPTFAIIKPAIANTCVDMSPYGMSVFEDAIDAIQAVDLCFDAVFNEIDLGKLRVFLSDMLIDVSDGEGGKRPLPFGKDDCTVFRKVQSNDDLIHEYAPALRTEAQLKAYRTALQTLGDLTGFGLTYFDIDEAGGIRTATEVSSDNSQLMRNIKKHENKLSGAITAISRSVLHCARKFLGVQLPEEGVLTVSFDDSIIMDTAAEKAQDMAEVDVTLNDYEYRMKWYNEDEETAKANVPRARMMAQDHPAFEPNDEGGDSFDDSEE